MCPLIRNVAAASVCRVLFVLLWAAGASPAQEPVPITVQLDWKPGVQFAGLLLAQERGWYRNAGLAVTIRANDFKRPYVDVVAEDGHTIGTSEARTLVEARSAGRPIRAVATMFQSSPVVLISLKNRHLTSLDDLSGKTLGIHRPADEAMLKTVFGARFFVPRRVGFDFVELLSGEVDAAPGYVMDEPLRLAQNGIAVNVLPLAEHGWTDYAQVLFTSEEFLAKDPEAIGRFLAVTFRGWRAALASPAATAELITPQYPADLSAKSSRRALRRLAPLMSSESTHLGTMKAETWRQIIANTRAGDDRGAHPVRVEDLVDFRYTPTLEKD